MEKISKFINKHKIDLIIIFVLSFIYILTTYLNTRTGVAVVDIGRELYIPQTILNGKVLYKDVFMMHPPLSYQLNAIFFRLFGTSFTTITIVSFVNSYMILLSAYFILRQFLKATFSFSITVFIMTIMFFTDTSIMNWVYPYSYGMTYSINAYLISVFCIIKYVKTEKSHPLFVHISSLFLGIAFAMKQEFAILYIPLLALLYKKDKKLIFGNILCFAIVPLISWGILFLYGLRIEDIYSHWKFLNTLVKTDEWYVYTFWENDPLWKVLGWRVLRAISAILSFTFYFWINTLIFKKITNNFNLNQKLERKELSILLLMLFIVINILVISYFYGKLVLLLFVLNLPLPFMCHQKYKNKDKDFVIFTILTVWSYLLTVRELFTPFSYSRYVFILPLILILTFIFKSHIQAATKKTFCAFLLLLSLMIAFTNIAYKEGPIKKIKTSKGDFYMSFQNARTYKYIIDWLNKNTKKTDKIIVWPEAPLLNFITDNPSDDRYFQLSPDHIKAFNERKIINDVTQNPPDYIILQKIDYYMYGAKYWGEDYATSLMLYILRNYNLVVHQTNGYTETRIYKNKSLKETDTNKLSTK